ncbi:FAD-dependent oxidoreductase [Planctomonas sp. JC2975]|nr:FAD-dependent oxidoreductase [Planctomonas sp. JC2975]
MVGGGPAGLSSALTAAHAGLRVALVDAGSRLGGQFWRHPDPQSLAPGQAESDGQHSWRVFERMRAQLRGFIATGRVLHLAGHTAWSIERGESASVVRLTRSWDAVQLIAGSVRSEHVILCPGGYDRQLPVPGWTVPGVMAAGGVQALVKNGGRLDGRRAVVTGTGPFLLPVAAALTRAGATVVAVCEANPPSAWLTGTGSVLRMPSKIAEALEFGLVLGRHRIPYRTRTAVTRIHGTDHVEGVTLSRVRADGGIVPSAGARSHLEVDLVALGWGFTPDLGLAVAAGAEVRRDVDGSLVAVVDDDYRSSVAGLSIAGEATGVGGAMMAVHEGELAASAVASETGVGVGPARAARLRRAIARERAFARAMHGASALPAGWTAWLDPDTVVCRCEEVSAGDIRNACGDLGADDARTVKALTRAGMGWCQGRVCGFATCEVTASCAARSSTADDLRAMSKRVLASPVRLGDLAASDDTQGPR